MRLFFVLWMCFLLLWMCFLFVSVPVMAADTLTVSGAYALATAPQQKAGAVFMNVENTGNADDRLIGAEADVSDVIEIHTMDMSGDMMMMRQVEGVGVPVGEKTVFKPEGYHLMLIGLHKPLVVGESFLVTLKFEKAGDVHALVDVRAPYTPVSKSEKTPEQAADE